MATPQLVSSVTASAATIEAAHEHTVGTLDEDELQVVVTGTTASVSDCLDEQDWYVVEDSSGKADPAVERGHFRSTAKVTEHDSTWLVAQFTPGSQPC